MKRDLQAEHVDRYGVGDFGDLRLKKQAQSCTLSWSENKTCACGNSAGTGRERCVSVAFWRIHA